MSEKGYGVSAIMSWSFKDQDLPKEWLDHLGDVPQNFSMYVDGDGGHGKTEYLMMLAKVICIFLNKKVFLNNCEQKKHKGIQISAIRNKFEEIPGGKFIYRGLQNFEKLKEQLRRQNSGRFVIIDSISFFPLSAKQVQELFEEFPNKNFILVAYLADKVKNKPIMHLCDIKIRLEDFVAKCRASRFGAGCDFVVRDMSKEIPKVDPLKGTLFEASPVGQSPKGETASAQGKEGGDHE
jgi:hypothetical protein